jgi:hypothetical protein
MSRVLPHQRQIMRYRRKLQLLQMPESRLAMRQRNAKYHKGTRRNQMTAFLILAGVTLLSFSVGACRRRDQRKDRYAFLDGGVLADREECKKPTLDCFEKCYKREASVGCFGCCRDQDTLCCMEQEYSFESCETAP